MLRKIKAFFEQKNSIFCIDYRNNYADLYLKDANSENKQKSD
jgi:hypothetical protein